MSIQSNVWTHKSRLQKCIPPFYFQLGWYRRYSSLVSYDPSWYVRVRVAWHVKLISQRSLDTYTAQATVGDVNKAITNHKVHEVNSYAFQLDLTPS